MTKNLALFLIVAMLFGLCVCGASPAAQAETTAPVEAAGPAEASNDEMVEEDVFADWNKDAPALNVLIDYVDAVTAEGSPDFIPVEDRIAVFDMDGTLYGELFPTYLEYYMLAWRILKDPSIMPDAEMLALGRELRESVINHSFAKDMPIRHAIQAARAYSGLTIEEFADFVTSILVRNVDGFEGMTYATAFYLPMIEVVEYLQDNDFKVYVVSGSDRAICRTLIEGMFDIPYENIIGMDVAYEATGQNGTDGLDYVFTANDDVVRTDNLIIKNLKMNKVLQIIQDIGHQPVLSFGNSSGDVSMHMYTISKNPYRSEAFMLIADDEARDYANAEKALKLGDEWTSDGFHVISMKNDFRTIYGDDVVKTGSFHWADELAEDRVPVEVDYGTSELYSHSTMRSAISLIEQEFSSWEGCELHNIRYASDDCNSEENLKWMNELEEGKNYTQCIEFLSDFHSPKEGGGAWNADQEYTDWQWWLARTDGGRWELLTWGY